MEHHEQHPSRDEDGDDLPCFRHPDRRTALQCIACDRPICTDCAIAAPVGLKCRECSRQSRSARGKVPLPKLVRAAATGLACAAVLGFAHRFLQVPFLSLILAWAAGRIAGAAVRAASGGYRDVAITRIATMCTIVGFAAAYLDTLLSLRGGALTWSLLYIAAAAFGAFQQSDS